MFHRNTWQTCVRVKTLSTGCRTYFRNADPKAFEPPQRDGRRLQICHHLDTGATISTAPETKARVCPRTPQRGRSAPTPDLPTFAP